VSGTVAAGGDVRKHTFDFGLDTERTFAHDGGMDRTCVRPRRRLAASAVLFLALAVGTPVARAVVGSDPPAGGTGGPAGRTYVVAPGDTLWAIAERAAPGDDPRAVVLAIAQLNGLDGTTLVPGQTLVLPQVG